MKLFLWDLFFWMIACILLSFVLKWGGVQHSEWVSPLTMGIITIYMDISNLIKEVAEIKKQENKNA